MRNSWIRVIPSLAVVATVLGSTHHVAGQQPASHDHSPAAAAAKELAGRWEGTTSRKREGGPEE